MTAGGFGAELAAQLQAAAFDYLEAPIQRVGAPYTPVPVSPPLEDAYRPGRGGDRTRGDESRSSGASYDVEPWEQGALAAPQRAPSTGSARSSASSRRAGNLLEQAAVAEHDLEIRQRQAGVLARDAVGAGALALAIASTSQRWWRWATIRISRDSGSSACWSTSALGAGERQRRGRPRASRSSSGLCAIFSSRAWNASLSAT